MVDSHKYDGFKLLSTDFYSGYPLGQILYITYMSKKIVIFANFIFLLYRLLGLV